MLPSSAYSVAQIAEYVALPMPVPRLPGQGQVPRRNAPEPRPCRPRKCSMLPRPLWASLCNARIVQFACDGQRRLEVRTGRFHAARLAVERPRLISARHSQRGPRSRALAPVTLRTAMRASSSFPEAIRRGQQPSPPWRPPLPSPGMARTKDTSSIPTWKGPRNLSPAQARSSAFAATWASPRAAARRQATTKLSSSAQSSAIAAFSSRPAKYAPCRDLRCKQRGGTAPRVASLRAQVLRCVLLHAHEKIEASVGHLSHE